MDDDEERDLRIELMKAQIDHTRLDMVKLQREMRWEPYKAFAAIIAGVAAMCGVILAVAHYIRP
jgi:hypothetical protein